MEDPTVAALRYKLAYAVARTLASKSAYQKNWWLNASDRLCRAIITLVGFD